MKHDGMEWVLLVAVVALLAVVLASCSAPSDSLELEDGYGVSGGYGIFVWHDDTRNVTCWVFREYRKGGLSCLPDWQLDPPPPGGFRYLVGEPVHG